MPTSVCIYHENLVKIGPVHSGMVSNGTIKCVASAHLTVLLACQRQTQQHKQL